MNRKEIDKDHLPKGEMLAGNFKPGSYGYLEKIVGHIYEDEGVICAIADDTILENCTHYIDIHQTFPAVK